VDWRQYEKDVTEMLRERVGANAAITHDTKVAGADSGIERQIDILVEGSFAGLVDAKMVVDCKFFGSSLDVNDVGTFISLVQDVRADLGLMITTVGYTQAAQDLARSTRGIHVDVISLSELEEWKMPLLSCQSCAETRNPESMPGMYWLDSYVTVEVEPEEAPSEDEVPDTRELRAGQCGICATWHFECPECGTMIAAMEILAGSWQYCEGCGVQWYLSKWYDSDGGEDDLESRLTLRYSDD
jgi:hypothetical protein